MNVLSNLRQLGRLLAVCLLLLALASAPVFALTKVHVVQRGDTLSSIARRYDVSISVLAAHNGIDHSDYIFVGQRVIVPVNEAVSTPSLGIHTVRLGDTLPDIAALYSVSLEKLLFFNGIESSTSIWVGQPLLVPIAAIPAPLSPVVLREPIEVDPNATTHRVRRGDTLFSISRAYGLDVQLLASHNQLLDPTRLAVGQNLSLPRNPPTAPVFASQPMPLASSVVHTVTLGDSLHTIAEQFEVSVKDLMLINGLSHNSLIWVGQSLNLPMRIDGSTPVIKQVEIEIQPADVPEPPMPEVETGANRRGLPQAPENFVHIVRSGETLSDIAQKFEMTAIEVSEFNSLASRDLIFPGQRLLIPRKTANSKGYLGKRWVEIDLSSQTLTAWDDEDVYLHVKISSGLSKTPTPVGHYNVWHMNESQTMSGPGYSLPNVKFNMYFHRGYAMHGAYWHNNFGQPMSHGCVNMREEEAEKLYRFIDLGTEVWVHS